MSSDSTHIDSETIRAAIKDLPYPLPTGPEKGGEHCWSQVGGETFEVRGNNYLKDKKKIKGNESIFDLMHVDLFTSNDRIGNLAARQDSWLRKARAAGDTRYYLVIVYVTPAVPYVHVVIYYAVNQAKVDATPSVKATWEKFTAKGEEGDKYRNERWKVIPRIAEGSWMIQKAVGTKPALLATKLKHHWILCDAPHQPAAPKLSSTAASSSSRVSTTRGRGSSFHVPSSNNPGPYIEADCDVASSSMAFVLVSMLQSYAKNIVFELGFAIEPRTEAELPEAIFGCVRLSRIDVHKPVLLAAQPGDLVLGTTLAHAPSAEEGEEEE